MQRRDFIKLTAGGLFAGAVLPGAGSLAASASNPFRLTASAGDYRFLPDQPATRVLHYNESIPGPVIRIPRGRESLIRFHNALDEPSSVHWHGLRIDNAMDGVPGMTQAAVPPEGEFDYRLNPPDSGTYWYHTHQRSWWQLALGLAGVLIVEEDNPPRVDRDLVFAIDDWRLDRSGQFDRASLGSLHDWSHAGRVGNHITINGEIKKNLAVLKGERVRLRMVNIANARTMRLQLNQPGARVIAVDGQPVRPFAPETGVVTLAPGQRSDLIIDITADPGHDAPVELLLRDQAYEIARWQTGAEIKREALLESPIALEDNPANRVVLPEKLAHYPLLMEGGAMGGMRRAIVQGKTLTMGELVQNKLVWAMNGVAGLPEEPLFRAKRGAAISLDVVNATSWPHAMHIHGHHFKYSRSPDHWRDTVLLSREEQGSMQFVADNPGKWLIHCHMVEHMASGMLTWFEVI